MYRTQSTLALMICLLCGLVAAVSCSTDEAGPPPAVMEPEPPQTIIEAQITASPQANPDIKGRPSPIVVHLYELKALGAFEAADFFGLLENGESLLGGDLVAKESFYLQPGETKLYRNAGESETKYLAAIAAYRDLNQAIWRDAIAIAPNETNKVMIFVNELLVTMKIEKPITVNKNEND